MGSFARLGWAWNLKRATEIPHPGPARSVTMEGLESGLIFVYGISNVFLEHLSAWGDEWVAQDFEHVAISVLFIGGGLVSVSLDPS